MPAAAHAISANGETEALKKVENSCPTKNVNLEDTERGAKGALSLLAVVILAAAYLVAFCSRLFAVIRFESIIHEFDPW